VSLVPSLLARSAQPAHGQARCAYELGKTSGGSGRAALPRRRWCAGGGRELCASRARAAQPQPPDFKGFVEELLAAFEIEGQWRPILTDLFHGRSALRRSGLLGFVWEPTRDALPLRLEPPGVRGQCGSPRSRPRRAARTRLRAFRRCAGPRVGGPAERTQDEVGVAPRSGGLALVAAELFDHYRGKHIPSVTWARFQSDLPRPDRTLEDKDVTPP